MKCPVCGKLHQEVECPRCSFPDIQLMGDWETEIKKFAPVMEQYKQALLRSVRIEIPVYTWKDSGGALVQDRLEWLPLGDGVQLLDTAVWCGRQFSRIPDVESLQVTVRVVCQEAPRQVTVTLPNRNVPKLQELGAAVQQDLTFRLLLRCQGEDAVSSAAIALFEADQQ